MIGDSLTSVTLDERTDVLTSGLDVRTGTDSRENVGHGGTGRVIVDQLAQIAGQRYTAGDRPRAQDLCVFARHVTNLNNLGPRAVTLNRFHEMCMQNSGFRNAALRRPIRADQSCSAAVTAGQLSFAGD
jgi:hypothetical protein